MSVVRTLLRKELIDSLRDRRTLVMMMVVPLLLYPALLLLIGFMTSAGKARLAKAQLPVALVGPEAEKLLPHESRPPLTPMKPMARAEAEQALRETKIWAFVDVPAGSLEAIARGEQAKVELVYTKRHDRSMEAHDRLTLALQKQAGQFLIERLEQAKLPKTFGEPLKTEALDLDFREDLGPLIASRILPAILLVMLFMGALYPAIDVTAGEKERGTLETLLVAPVRPMHVMLAKYLTVALIAVLVTVLNLAAMAATFRLGLSFAEGATISLKLAPKQIAMMLLCLAPAAFMASAVSLAVASMARSFKEAQSLLSPVMIIASIPGLAANMPGIELNHLTAIAPLLNVALLVKGAVLGTATWSHLALVVSSVGICAAIAVWMAANAFKSEALRFGGAESWRELFRLR